VCVPAPEDVGTVMEPVKLPVESVVIVVGVVVIPAPSYDIVIPEFAAKFLPVTVTVVPVGPLVGFSDIVTILYTAVSWVLVLIDTVLGLTVDPVSSQ